MVDTGTLTVTTVVLDWPGQSGLLSPQLMTVETEVVKTVDVLGKTVVTVLVRLVPGAVVPGAVVPGAVVPGAVVPGAVVPGAVVGLVLTLVLAPGWVLVELVVPGAVVPGAVVPGAVVPGAVVVGLVVPGAVVLGAVVPGAVVAGAVVCGLLEVVVTAGKDGVVTGLVEVGFGGPQSKSMLVIVIPHCGFGLLG